MMPAQTGIALSLWLQWDRARLSGHGSEANPHIGAAHGDRPNAAAALLCLAGLVLLVLAAGLLLSKRHIAPPVTLIVEASHAQLEAGFALYRRHCAACHGAFLGGAAGWREDARLAPALNDAGHAFNHTDLELFRRVAEGVRAADGRVTMPAFGNVLSGDEIVTLLSYIAAWWPDAVRSSRVAPGWSAPAICGPGGATGGPAADAT
jgi:mono/diheme cytochrome c family protein